MTDERRIIGTAMGTAFGFGFFMGLGSAFAAFCFFMAYLSWASGAPWF